MTCLRRIGGFILKELQGKINKYLPEVPESSFSEKIPVEGSPGLRQGSQITG